MIHRQLKEDDILFAEYQPPRLSRSHNLQYREIPNYLKSNHERSRGPAITMYSVISLDPNHYANQVVTYTQDDILDKTLNQGYMYRPGRYIVYYLESRRRRTQGMQIDETIGRILQDSFFIRYRPSSSMHPIQHTDKMDVLASEGKMVNGQLSREDEILTCPSIIWNPNFADGLVPTKKSGIAVGVSSYEFDIQRFSPRVMQHPDPEPFLPRQAHWSTEQIRAFAAMYLQPEDAESLTRALNGARSPQTEQLINRKVTNDNKSHLLNKNEPWTMVV